VWVVRLTDNQPRPAGRNVRALLALLIAFTGAVHVHQIPSRRALEVAPLDHGRQSGDPRPQVRCTTVIVGRAATAGGEVLLGHNEDLGDSNAQHYLVVGRAQHEAGEVVTLWSGAEVPQVEETSGYIATSIFDVEYTPGDLTSGINEHQVSVANNLAEQRDADPDVPVEGRILWSELTRFALERARTAREGVMVIGDLVHAHGLAVDTGTMFAVTDPVEGWWIEIAQEGQWVAQRVADDAASVRANAYRISVVDLDDDESFLSSPDVIDHAVAMGWYDETDGPFDFARVYGDAEVAEASWNTHREDRVSALLNRHVPAVTVLDMMAVLRDHYEGTALDLSESYTIGSPHRTDEYCVCDLSTEVSVVCQSRGWLPAEIGGVCWRAMATPCTSVYIPWYVGQIGVPSQYATGTDERSPGSAYWTFRDLAEAVDARYGETARDVRGMWEELEAREVDEQAADEAVAMDLYATDPEEAREVLSARTSELAVQAYDRATALLANGLDVDELSEEAAARPGDGTCTCRAVGGRRPSLCVYAWMLVGLALAWRRLGG